ncbi:hypothetical protein PR003_g28757 [Phytophthora rubi]|uniref:RxLR effector protein n=1 Tax=Phytophthora rubi TaxID=129364 RepID=A0A6A3HID6_9STRA|nr:hypothetical protein PR002_g27654 [Phytophthora rubi]KAE8997008.1 hypothetical protein PR001_g19699 [Phytophthora rubi]KAE9277566.1 hypothetical protein PR003_g28757 [Phytophthora rubi]
MSVRLYFVVLLTVVALTASASATTEFQKTSLDTAREADRLRLTPVQRSLRTTNLEEEGEERGIIASGLTKIKGTVSGIKSKINNAKLITWLNDRRSTDYAFTKLKLHLEGENLFKSPKLNLWVEYRQLYNNQNGIRDSSGIATLLKHYDDEVLSRMIEAARLDPKTAKIANEFRFGQVAEWLRTKTDPNYVNRMLNVKGTAFEDANRKLWRAYRQEYDNLYIVNKPPRNFDNIV